MTQRGPNAGVTLLEMLVALSISALIGVAGFALLDSVTRTEAALSGRLAQLEAQDRAFRLLALDLTNATRSQVGDTLELRLAGHKITWQASDTGLVRSLTFQDGNQLRQDVLDDPSVLSIHAPGVISLDLPESDVRRLIPLPVVFLE
ncbi:MAG: prepilin-type N-terminal cleavage/methylation domain-containing protein [Pseudomonadota bacterium]